MQNPYPDIDIHWTLFLARDGVLVSEVDLQEKSFSPNPSFLPGVLESIGPLTSMFGKIAVVTNESRIEAETISLQDLNTYHDNFVEQIAYFGGRIDEIYFCTDAPNTYSSNLIPNPGLALQAKQDFPSIDFRKSILIGGSDEDIQFGKILKMKTVKIGRPSETKADYRHPSIHDFNVYINNI